MGSVDFNDIDLLLEGLESSLPLSEVLRVENIIVEGLKLADLILYAVSDGVNGVTRAGDSLQVVTKNSKEFLEHNTGSVEVSENKEHVFGADKDVFDVGEIPSADGNFCLNIHFGLVELVLPLLKDGDTLLDNSD